jgi:hypothetical protein
MSEERVLDSYFQLLTDYSSLEEQLEKLQDLHHRPEANLGKYDDEFERLIDSKTKDLEKKILEAGPLCDYIDTSQFKEQSYILFKENFDNTNGFKLPESAQEFLDYVLDYMIQSCEMTMRRAELALHDTFPTLTGTNFELEEEFEITMDMLKDNSDELDGIYVRWKNRDGTIRFMINGDVSNPVHSSKNVGGYIWALIQGYNGYMGRRHGELTAAIKQGKVVMCRLHTEHTDFIDIDGYL